MGKRTPRDSEEGKQHNQAVKQWQEVYPIEFGLQSGEGWV